LKHGSPTRSHAFSRFAFAFLGLAIAVFAWGLQYKLSLYDPPQAASRTMPQAKLLSREQQNAEVESPFAQSDETAMGTACAAVFSLLFFGFFLFTDLTAPLSALKQQEADRPWRLRQAASLNPFFFRPPPRLA
jgi:hypothetical protein